MKHRPLTRSVTFAAFSVALSVAVLIASNILTGTPLSVAQSLGRSDHQWPSQRPTLPLQHAPQLSPQPSPFIRDEHAARESRVARKSEAREQIIERRSEQLRREDFSRKIEQRRQELREQRGQQREQQHGRKQRPQG